jgi:hypothetical protein
MSYLFLKVFAKKYSKNILLHKINKNICLKIFKSYESLADFHGTLHLCEISANTYISATVLEKFRAHIPENGNG